MTRSLCPKVSIEYTRKQKSLRKEFFRKAIHMCTAFVPVLLHYMKIPGIILLLLALTGYVLSEILRLKGYEIPLVSDITKAAARKRDENKFVLGPVTLVTGIVLCSILWPELPATAGIFALAFGDGSASLAGKAFGKITIPFTGGKTVAGSLTCFTAIYVSSFSVIKDSNIALILAATGTVIEVLPLKDLDNVLIPVVIGGLAAFLLPHI